jgi:hypothetical protein
MKKNKKQMSKQQKIIVVACSSLTKLITFDELKLICHNLVVQVRCSPLFMKKNAFMFVLQNLLGILYLNDGYFYKDPQVVARIDAKHLNGIS